MGSKISGWMLLASFIAPCTFGATANLTGKVFNFLYDDTNYGGCMALMAPGPESAAGVTCGDNWVTFDCTGNFSTKSQAANKVSAAQLAFVTEKFLFVQLDDTKKHNGFCYAKRVDNLSTE